MSKMFGCSCATATKAKKFSCLNNFKRNLEPWQGKVNQTWFHNTVKNKWFKKNVDYFYNINNLLLSIWP